MIVGEFGAAKREADPNREPEQFGFFGEVFTIKPTPPSAMPLMEFAAAMMDQEGEDGPVRLLAAMHGMLRSCLVKGDFPRFAKIASDNDCDAELLMEVCAKVYEVISGRPTESPSGSVGGQSSPSASSSPSSTRRAALGLIPVDQVSLLTG